MELFRSEDMALYEISIPKDDAWDIMNQLGQLDCMHFIDLNKNEQVFALRFANLIKRCDDSEKRITFLQNECKRHNIKLEKPRDVNDFMQIIEQMRQTRNIAPSLFFEQIESGIKTTEEFVNDQTKKEKDMFDNFNQLIEYKKVLQETQVILARHNGVGHGALAGVQEDRSQPSINMDAPDENPLMGHSINLSYIAGTINTDEVHRFQKLIFRVTRGNSLPFFVNFEHPIVDYHGVETQKSVYVVLFQEGGIIREKIEKICDSFMGQRFDIPNGDFQTQMVDIDRKLRETRQVMMATKDEVQKYLEKVNTIDGVSTSALIFYKWFMVKERGLYQTLNKLKFGDKLLVGLFWTPISKTIMIDQKLNEMRQDRNIDGPQIWQRRNHEVTPPTYFKTNEFTAPFQAITDTYGVPDYKEANPSVFGIVTFPFLFGVMFGDVGHGGMLLIFAIFLCLMNDKLQKTGLAALCGARYLLLLMGFFATFCGICYNDFMSIPIWAGTCYEDTTGNVARPRPDCVYPIGVDPKWYTADNELEFVNGMKMKISVIFGIAQMSIGIFMKAANSLYFKRYVDFIFEFIPQIILLWALFGWMDLLIIVKWLTPWSDDAGTATELNTTHAPNIITIMIGMFLAFGEVEEGASPLIGSAGTQQAISISLLLIFFICVPLMLFVKPLYLRSKMKNAHRHDDGNYNALHDEEEELDASDGATRRMDITDTSNMKAKEAINLDQIIAEEFGSHEEHAFSEIFIHQLIETIEFVLGSISNTASYLRLWALSLAHGQLAAVFYEKLLEMALNINNIFISGIATTILFPAFFSFTFGILMCMDSMECFLHTLRLHWVEFQNKFFGGNGYAFAPFSFTKELEDEVNA